jgi:4-amino-4-deoxy-L-arabinose transferase-like glycosyltransferase
VTTSINIAPKKNAKDLAARIGWAVLICATLYVCYFSHLGAIGFVGPDEPRYAWIARDIAETGDWVTPRLYGKPWFEKPPLYYWGAAICFKLFGVSEAAARLPSAISALLATLALAWLAWRIYGTETARWLLLLLPTTVGMIGFSHAAATDMPFSAMLTIAMVCAAVLLRLPLECGGLPPLSPNEPVATKMTGPPATSAVGTPGATPPVANTSWLATILFGFFLGLAMLAKGPAAIILCGGAVFFWVLFTKRWRDALRLFHPAAIASFCATALPWYILCARRNPDFFRIFIIEHNFKRYLTPEFQHIQPFWFYIPIVLIAFLPWTVLLLWSVCIGAVRAWRSRNISQSMAYVLAWSLFCIVFFSISKSKLPGYILPSIPAISVLVAYSYAAVAPNALKSFRLALLTGALLLFTVFAFAEWSALHLSRSNERFGIAVGLVAAALGIANFALAIAPVRGKTAFHQLAGACCVVPILLTLSLADRLLPALFKFDPSGRSLARELQLRKIPTESLRVYAIGRSLQYSLNFYLHEEIRAWDRDHPTDGYVLTNHNSKNCGFLAFPTATCEKVSFDLGYETGRFLYRVSLSQSPTHPPSSGKPQ